MLEEIGEEGNALVVDLISVIVPIYNVKPYLGICIDSILNQTYHNLEIILVDDGSTDGCADLCDEYASCHENILVIHKENGGLSSARNAGLAAATGDFLSFIDSDDYLHPMFYETLLLPFKEDLLVDVSCCKYQEVSEKQTDILPISASTFVFLKGEEVITHFKEDISTVIPISAWSKLYRKEVFQSILFPEGHIYEDFYVLPHILEQVGEIATCSAELYYYRIRESSILQSPFSEKRFDMLFTVKESLIPFYERHKDVLDIHDAFMLFINDFCDIYRHIYSTHLSVRIIPEEYKQYYRKAVSKCLPQLYRAGRKNLLEKIWLCLRIL